MVSERGRIGAPKSPGRVEHGPRCAPRAIGAGRRASALKPPERRQGPGWVRSTHLHLIYDLLCFIFGVG